MNQLQGRIAIVTGGAKGLGEAVVRLFVAEGATVIVADVDADSGARVVESLGAKTRFQHLDVRIESEWERVIGETVAAFGRLDILVNNAGVIEIGSIETQTAEQWRLVNAVIADGAFFGCKHAVRAMKTTGGGKIVNVASIASLQGEPYVAAYCAAKGAVEALTRSVAVHCAQMKYNIRCNSIHPGRIETPLTAAIPGQMKAAMKAGFKMASAQGATQSYTAQAEEIAPAVLYLASDSSKYVNGTRLVIDNTMSVTSGVVPP
jgi:3(or 17)beta-hydroxysteroid dehydrogenase